MQKNCGVILVANEGRGALIASNARHGGLFLREYYGSPFLDRGDVEFDLYIVADEVIKEGDWYTNQKGVFKCNNLKYVNPERYYYLRKIIFTTNPTLIASGVLEVPKQYLLTYCSVHNEGRELKEVAVEISPKVIEGAINEWGKPELHTSSDLVPTIVYPKVSKEQKLYTRDELLKFVGWYSGMHGAKIVKALDRYEREKLSESL